MASEISLYRAKTGNTYDVVTIPEVELLKSLGIRQGSSVEMICRYPLGGPVLLRIEDSSTVAIGKDIASLVSVLPKGIRAGSEEDVA